MSQGTVKLIIESGIATITFFHPQSNSLPGSLLQQLAKEIESAGKNKDVRVIILKSEGEKAFCAGASFDELVSIKNTDEGKLFFSGFAAVINAMRKAPKFIIARIHGKAVGGGVGLACAADYTLAHDSASVKLSELAVGIGPFVVGPAVERKIGNSNFSALSINATEWQSAEWAKEKGMYANVYSSTSELDEAVSSLANKLAKSNPEAMALLKKVFWNNTDHWDQLLQERAELSGQLVTSDFTRNAIEKFKAGAR
ncbi:MAG TPA: enoyl-CoA hydratase/isomerase family protein [Bacteroidia bacterium]|nr:enoyl-CoA hydratase/isomerase family protein [Bacteroidia bacterium]HNS12683.1 enoyl-CoA hydratase/isomerase family protein [Bacteroidia bacterium]